MYEKQGNPGNSKQILTRAPELSGNNPYWNYRLLFQVGGLFCSGSLAFLLLLLFIQTFLN